MRFAEIIILFARKYLYNYNFHSLKWSLVIYIVHKLYILRDKQPHFMIEFGMNPNRGHFDKLDFIK